MEIAVIGMNQDTAPIHIRNKVAYLESDKIDFTTQLLDEGISEVIILATCGRNEIYICDYKANMQHTIDRIIEMFASFFSFPEVKEYLYTKVGDEAIAHLYRVSAGLDSIVLGEDQILGQVKEAQHLAIELGASKKILNRLFREAITTAKAIKTDLKISEHPMSIAYIGVKFIIEQLQTIKDKSILIIGTGKMGRLALEYINEQSPKAIYMSNRNHEKVIDLQKNYPAIQLVEYSERQAVFHQVDAIITATASPHHVIKPEDLKDHHQLVVLDLALPQDVDESVNDIEGVTLYNVDSLNKISVENEKRRLELSKQAMETIKDKRDDFKTWMLSIKVDPTIKSLNTLRTQVEADTLEYIHRKLSLDQKSKKLVDKMISSSLKRMIRNPIIKLKSIEDEEKMHHYLEVLNDLFGLEGE